MADATPPAVEVAPAPDDVRENGPSPVYYRVPEGTARVPFRLVLGGADRPAWTAARARGAFGLSIGAGIPTNLFSLAPSHERASPLAWVVDLGYAYASFSEHLAFLGLGPHVRTFLSTSGPLGGLAEGPLHASLTPHLVLGAREGDFAVGLRTALVAGFSIFGVELAHQVTHTSANDAHAFYALAGLASSMELAP